MYVCNSDLRFVTSSHWYQPYQSCVKLLLKLTGHCCFTLKEFNWRNTGCHFIVKQSQETQCTVTHAELDHSSKMRLQKESVLNIVEEELQATCGTPSTPQWGKSFCILQFENHSDRVQHEFESWMQLYFADFFIKTT